MRTLTLLILMAAPAWAWKPTTHMYLAKQAKDSIRKGKVSVMVLKDGKTSTLGKYEVDPDLERALKKYPQQYYAGVCGPDCYPDLFTGQGLIHPDIAVRLKNKHGGQSAKGTDAWLTHLWHEVHSLKKGTERDKARAFLAGYLTHAAGDLFAHTLVNVYAGGAFSAEDKNWLRHVVVEGYVGKRTPKYSIGKDISIDGLRKFIYRTFVKRANNSKLLRTEVDSPGGETLSIPRVYSALRRAVKKRKAELEKKKVSVARKSRIKYLERWIAAIDDGLAKWPKTGHQLALALVYSKKGHTDLNKAKKVMEDYRVNHLNAMSGMPTRMAGLAKSLHKLGGELREAVDKLLFPRLRKKVKALRDRALDALFEATFGMTPKQWKDAIKDPGKNFNKFVNSKKSKGKRITLAKFNKTELGLKAKGIEDKYKARFRIGDVPAAYNTLVLTQLSFLSDTALKRMMGDLAKKMGTKKRSIVRPNAVLGYITSLDDSREWCGHKKMPFALDAKLFWGLFKHQTGMDRKKPC